MRVITSILMSACLASGAGLQVKVVEGNGVVNSLRQGRARDLVVEVQDESGKPVKDASVTAILPPSGVGGYFGEPFHNSIAMRETNGEGRVTFRGIHLRKLTGEYPIRFVARSGALTGETTATQRISDVPPAESDGYSKTRMVLIGILAGAAGVGVAMGLHNAHTGSPGSSAFTVTPGAPTLTGPR